MDNDKKARIHVLELQIKGTESGLRQLRSYVEKWEEKDKEYRDVYPVVDWPKHNKERYLAHIKKKEEQLVKLKKQLEDEGE